MQPTPVLRSEVYPPRAIEALHPIHALQRLDTHARSCFRRMYKAAIADVDADVGERTVERVVENEIARLQLFQSHGSAALALLGRSARHADAPGLLVDVGDEAAAIEASRVRGAAVAIIEAEREQ